MKISTKIVLIISSLLVIIYATLFLYFRQRYKTTIYFSPYTLLYSGADRGIPILGFYLFYPLAWVDNKVTGHNYQLYHADGSRSFIGKATYGQF